MSTKSLSLDGVNEYVDMGNVAPLSFNNTTQFTLVVWFKTFRSGADQMLITKQENSVNFRGYSLALLTSGVLRFQLINTVTTNHLEVQTFDYYLDALWHQAVVTYNGSQSTAGVKIYVDGQSRNLTSVTNTLSATTTNTETFKVGVRGTVTSPFEGYIDDVAVYNSVLISSDVDLIYALGTPPDLTVVGPTANLIGYWQMGDGATFPTIPDDSVNNNNGTMTNMEAGDIINHSPSPPVLVTAKSLSFDGVDEYLAVPFNTQLDFNFNEAFSVSVWVKSTDTAAAIIGNMTPVSTLGWSIEISGAVIQFYLSNTASNRILVTIPIPTYPSLWNHIVFTYSGNGLASGVVAYVNTTVQTVTTVTNNLSSMSTVSAQGMALGARPGNTVNMLGKIDEVVIYSKVLSTVEVRAIYNVTQPPDLLVVGAVASLLGWWRMGDSDTYPTIIDHSTFANHGTMTNMEVGDISLDAPPPLTRLIYDVEEPNYLQPKFQMRASADPGPGFVTWRSLDLPDYAGTYAPSAIQAGTAIIASEWVD